MSHSWSARRLALVASAALAAIGPAAGCSKGDGGGGSGDSAGRDGSEGKPLVVMLIPSETGSRSVLDDYGPLFGAITRVDGIHFKLAMGDSYNAVVEGMVAGHIDVAFFGPVVFDEARRRGAAELLAVEETGGKSIYYAGIYHRKDSGLTRLTDLRGKSLALGDPKSASSFVVQVSMLLEAGIDPARDLGKILMAGSHSASLEELEAGHVDAAAASINAYDKAVEAGAIDGSKVVLLAKSGPIPSPPIAMRAGLPPEIKDRLRKAFDGIHKAKGVTKEMILGYGGKQVDRYNARFDPVEFDRAMKGLASVTDEVVNEIIQKASQR
jgi:phosphonate transport system substrate-binding protein